ncbi:hypothetical protein NIT7321_01356 [Phaeobacter italicus]|uniref:Uncharacterized protein n=1 Tax=Phaeobacter italicus TaxID=481446 RepID=A0A0H5D036_9RHOB|nr:hypothetical protein NIT7321_01356 [Phaeobacter italicus]
MVAEATKLNAQTNKAGAGMLRPLVFCALVGSCRDYSQQLTRTVMPFA